MNVSCFTIIIKVVVEHSMAMKVAMKVAMGGTTRFTVAAFLGVRTNYGPRYLLYNLEHTFQSKGPLV
jgi:hypothetical protein